MPFKKGQSGNPNGRKKGQVNKSTAIIKDALEQTFDKLGGVDHMINWAARYPTEFYKIYSKLLPTEIDASVNGDVVTTLKVEFVKPKPTDT